MPNQSDVLFSPDVPIRLVSNGDGTYSIATRAQSVGGQMAQGDIAASIFGINKPIRLVKLGDGSYALATSTAVTPRPSADLAVSIFGINVPIRLVALGDGTFALATVAS